MDVFPLGTTIVPALPLLSGAGVETAPEPMVQ